MWANIFSNIHLTSYPDLLFGTCCIVVSLTLRVSGDICTKGEQKTRSSNPGGTKTSTQYYFYLKK